jgi:aspartate racemase
MKILGIIGGLGPMATAHFLTLVTQMSVAATDQEHIEILMHSRPAIPDRTAFIVGKSPKSPEADLVALARELAAAGAEVIAIPCFTACYFYEAYSQAAGVLVLHPIIDTATHLREAGIKTAGIMATDGMLASRLYQEHLTRLSITPLVPEPDEQRQLMSLIYDDIKSGKPADFARFTALSQHLFERGAEAILLGCSELSLFKRDHPLPTGYLDVLEVLARSAVRECGELRGEYERLVV